MAVESENRIGVLASGSGTTFERARLDDLSGVMKATIAFVVCNNPPDKAEVWQRAAQLGLAKHTFQVNNQKFPDEQEPPRGTMSRAAAAEVLRLGLEYDVRMIVALGFMKRVVAPLLGGLPLVNTHPGPLPLTAGTIGEGAARRVMEVGTDYAGPTFHFMGLEVGKDGLPIYDDHRDIVTYSPVPVTGIHIAEYTSTGTAQKLFEDTAGREKATIASSIDLAMSEVLLGLHDG